MAALTLDLGEDAVGVAQDSAAVGQAVPSSTAAVLGRRQQWA